MKQFLVALFSIMYIVTISHSIHAALQNELNFLFSSLQALEQRLQSVSTERPLPPPPPGYEQPILTSVVPPPPPPTPGQNVGAVPKFAITKNYKVENNGNPFNFQLGLVKETVKTKGKEISAYSLYLYGPQLKGVKRHREQVYTEILESIQPNNVALAYPLKNPKNLLATKAYKIIDGLKVTKQQFEEQQQLEKNILPEWKQLKNSYDELEAKKHQFSPAAILNTPEKSDQEYIKNLQRTSKEINTFINTHYKKITDLKLLKEIKQSSEQFRDLLQYAQSSINEIQGRLMQTAKTINLSRQQKLNKFGEELSPLNRRDPKVKDYKGLDEKLAKGLSSIEKNINSLEEQISEQEGIQSSPIKLHYNKLIKGLTTSKATEEAQVEQGKEAAQKKHVSIFELAQEQKEELQKAIEEAEEGTGATAEEWSESEEEED